MFSTYVDHFLCPAWRPGQVVLLDNLAGHENEAVRAKIEAGGCRLVCFCPPASPDFPPSEPAFSQLKGFLRKARARPQETLHPAIGAGLATITAKDARGWCKHCEFPLPAQPL